MNKVSLLAFLLMIAIEGNTQDSNRKLSFGFSATPMLGIQKSVNENLASYNKKFDAGLVADIYLKVNERLQIRSGVGIRSVVVEGEIPYRRYYHNSETGFYNSNSYCIDFLSPAIYMSVPIGLKFELTNRWFANVGLENNFNNRSSEGWTSTICGESEEHIDISDRYNRVKYLPVIYASVGFESDLNDKLKLIFEPYFGIGSKESLEMVMGSKFPTPFINARLTNIGLRLGVIFEN